MDFKHSFHSLLFLFLFSANAIQGLNERKCIHTYLVEGEMESKVGRPALRHHRGLDPGRAVGSPPVLSPRPPVLRLTSSEVGREEPRKLVSASRALASGSKTETEGELSEALWEFES